MESVNTLLFVPFFARFVGLGAVFLAATALLAQSNLILLASRAETIDNTRDAFRFVGTNRPVFPKSSDLGFSLLLVD
jgi:hypothetical protein